jgi:hypothetical protein
MQTQNTVQPSFSPQPTPQPVVNGGNDGSVVPGWLKVVAILSMVLSLILIGLVLWLALERNAMRTQLSVIQKDIEDGTISVVQNDKKLADLKETVTREDEPGDIADDTLLLGKGDKQTILGLNTRTPAAELHLVGTKALGGDPDLELQNADKSQSWVLTSESANKGRFGLYNKTSNKNPFFIGAGAGTGSFFMDDRGFVGLGTVTPKQRLHVIGNIQIEGLREAGFADKPVCFDKDGVLRPCQDS